MIYFLQDSGSLNIKIGFTASEADVAAEVRRKALQTGCPSRLVVLATAPGSEQDEAKLHARFDRDCVGGEWFKPTPELLRLIVIQREAEAMRHASREYVYQPLRIYLAGKMDSGTHKSNKSGWRESIIEDVTDLDCNCEPDELESLPTLKAAIFGIHDCVGPYLFDVSGGHSSPSENSHGGTASRRPRPPCWRRRG